MPDIIVQSPTLGIQANLPDNLISDRAAADGTQNVDFDLGVIFPPAGFTKFDCNSNPLVTGQGVFGLVCYTEVNTGRVNLIAATETTILEHDMVNTNWPALSGATISANIFKPMSFASILHQDNINNTYQNLLICDGGNSNIVRWPGWGSDLVELAGGDGYNLGGETGHRALQVCSVQNRTILINPYEFTGLVWIPNLSRVRWPVEAKLETWTGTGSGFLDLIDTGDTNVWASILGNNLIIYQTHSIWQLRYVGGTTVFTPDIIIPNLGLLSCNLLTSIGSTHFFVGNDYNIYSMDAGSAPVDIGQPIVTLFKRDMDVSKKYAFRMVVGAQHKFLWIFIVTLGADYATKAYKYNLQTGAWTVRDLSNRYTSGGIMSSVLILSGTYTTGETYQQAVVGGHTYAQAAVAGTKYADTVTVIRSDEKLIVGDSDGYVLYEDTGDILDDGVEPTRYYVTKEFDGGQPDISKRICGIQFDAKGVIGGSYTITIEYKIDDNSWVSIDTVTLTGNFVSYRLFINRTGKKMRLRFSERFIMRSFGIIDVWPEDRR